MIHPQIIWLPYTHLPTTKSSPSVDPGRTRFQISMVKSVLALLKTDVRELISAAIMAANIRPFKPVVMDTELWLTKSELEHLKTFDSGRYSLMKMVGIFVWLKDNGASIAMLHLDQIHWGVDIASFKPCYVSWQRQYLSLNFMVKI